jgi:hypothetical protein
MSIRSPWPSRTSPRIRITAPKTWDIVQRLAEEQVPLVELGQSEGDDRSNVPITLTPEGETVAHTI